MKTSRPAELQELLMRDPALALVDVRTPLEFDEVHVPQARNLPLQVVCRSVPGYRPPLCARAR